MGYTLIIAEKPNAAMRIAEALSDGKSKKLGRDAPTTVSKGRARI